METRHSWCHHGTTTVPPPPLPPLKLWILEQSTNPRQAEGTRGKHSASQRRKLRTKITCLGRWQNPSRVHTAWLYLKFPAVWMGYAWVCTELPGFVFCLVSVKFGEFFLAITTHLMAPFPAALQLLDSLPSFLLSFFHSFPSLPLPPCLPAALSLTFLFFSSYFSLCFLL